MRHQLAFFSLLVGLGLVDAQEACIPLTSNFPSCAFTCILSAGSEIGCTKSDDVACRCTPASSSAIISKALPCVLGGCAASDINKALAAGSTICQCVATATPDPTSSSLSLESSSAEPSQTSEGVSTTSVPSSSSEPPPDSTSEPSPGSSSSEKPPESTSSGEHPSDTSTITSSSSQPCVTASPCQKSADAVPDCGEECIFSAAVTHAKCATEDFQCQCTSSAVIQSAAQDCVIEGCGIPGALELLGSVSALCDCVKESPTVPCPTESTTTSPGTPSGTPSTTPSGTPSGTLSGTSTSKGPGSSGTDTSNTKTPGSSTPSGSKTGHHPSCTKGGNCASQTQTGGEDHPSCTKGCPTYSGGGSANPSHTGGGSGGDESQGGSSKPSSTGTRGGSGGGGENEQPSSSTVPISQAAYRQVNILMSLLGFICVMLVVTL